MKTQVIHYRNYLQLDKKFKNRLRNKVTNQFLTAAGFAGERRKAMAMSRVSVHDGL